MRLSSMFFVATVTVALGCGSDEDTSPSTTQTVPLESAPPVSTTEDYHPGDCCYAECITSMGGGVGFCSEKIGKIAYGECTSRAKGYCQYKGLPFFEAYWARCTNQSGC